MIITYSKIILLVIIIIFITAWLTWIAATGHLAGKAKHQSNGEAKENLNIDGSSSTQMDTSPRMPKRIRSQIIPRSSSTRASSPDLERDAQFQSAIDIVSTSGDFRPLSEFFDSLNQNDRFLFFREIPSVFSKLGPKYDIAKKLAILEKVNASESDLATFRGKVLQMEARERYDEMKESGVLVALSDRDFAAICRSVASSRLKQGFEIIEDGGSDSAKRFAAAEVARYAIRAGTMEASKEIGNLPAGIVRDEAVAELVIWLRRTGSADEAEPWLKSIVDETAKSRLVPKSK